MLKNPVLVEMSFQQLEALSNEELLALYNKGRAAFSKAASINYDKISGILLNKNIHPKRKWAKNA